MGRVIFHSDANSFYATVECLYDPELRDKPVAVCGDPEERHGIVLTANRIAKGMGVKTGMAIWQAHQVCPELVAVKPDYKLYVHFSEMMRAIYDEYSDHVEAFGLDECWLDMTQPGLTIEEGARIADELRERIKKELGITVSIGVAENKVFAKLASDLRKPDYTTVISRENYRELAWPLPVSDLLFCGPHTTRKLRDFGIRTIGDLANADPQALLSRLGKNGLMLRAFARGEDTSRVLRSDRSTLIKSIGNSTTPPHDIVSYEDAKCIYYLLAESVAARLREQGFRCRRVSISVRQTDLQTFSCQRMLQKDTNLTDDIAQTALALFREHYMDRLPLRSVGLACSALSGEDAPVQLDLLGDAERDQKKEQLDRALDGLRKRYGHQVVQRGVVLADRQFSRINPKEESLETFHPFNR